MKKILFLMLFSLQINAAEISGPPLGLLGGVGFILKTNNRIDNNVSNRQGVAIFQPVPVILLHYGPLMIGGNGLTFSFIGDREKSAFVNLSPQGDKYEGTNMSARKESLFFGLGARYKHISASISRDISHRSFGTKFSLNYSRMFIQDELSYFRASITLDYFNRKYANYYYGVSNDEVSTTRSAYEANAYIEPGIGVFYIRKLNEKLSLTTGLSIKKYSQSVINSPTTKNIAVEFTNFNGLTWAFY